mmetsp:Transcript_3149/g.11371  ORF Transcript_3149/g.11371 Transcript_3149/m.11371 type:complete len:86 (-) Transcript_3149:947-1204(-)
MGFGSGLRPTRLNILGLPDPARHNPALPLQNGASTIEGLLIDRAIGVIVPEKQAISIFQFYLQTMLFAACGQQGRRGATPPSLLT